MAKLRNTKYETRLYGCLEGRNGRTHFICKIDNATRLYRAEQMQRSSPNNVHRTEPTTTDEKNKNLTADATGLHTVSCDISYKIRFLAPHCVNVWKTGFHIVKMTVDCSWIGSLFPMDALHAHLGPGRQAHRCRCRGVLGWAERSSDLWPEGKRISNKSRIWWYQWLVKNIKSNALW